MSTTCSSINGLSDIARLVIQHTKEDPTREGLADTPQRVDRAWRHWLSGYEQDARKVLTTFERGDKESQLIMVCPVYVFSLCEHHLAPFWGVACFAYQPKNIVCGLSKIQRLVNVLARRLQIQERLTRQIVSTFEEVVQPEGAGLVIDCRHMCMESRGIHAYSTITRTQVFVGSMEYDTNLQVLVNKRLVVKP